VHTHTAQAIFDGVDIDGSGSLSLNDFLAASINRRDLDERRLRLAFDRLDYDHNGTISIDDLELTVGTGADGKSLKVTLHTLHTTQHRSSFSSE
jgi:Ca2+-binding EF-hand superfamily protein